MYSFVACLSHLAIDPDPFRDGAPFLAPFLSPFLVPFLLLTEAPPTFGRSLTFFFLTYDIFFCVV